MLLLSDLAGATGLSGELQLYNQDILVTDKQNYQGQFDLRSKLPMGDEFVLTKVSVSFDFQDDQEWIRKAGTSSLENTGKIVRHKGIFQRNKRIAGQTDHYYIAKSIINLSNEEEVAKLSIGSNIYFGTTIRRREITTENMGQKSINLGAYRDDGDNNRTRQHFRVTQSVLESQTDGYDGLFGIGLRTLDLATVQDLAQTGVLNFELSAQGDYIFVEAKLEYEGFVIGPDVVKGNGNQLFSGTLWLALFSIPIGGLIWRKKTRAPALYKGQKRISQRKVPTEKAF